MGQLATKEFVAAIWRVPSPCVSGIGRTTPEEGRTLADTLLARRPQDESLGGTARCHWLCGMFPPAGAPKPFMTACCDAKLHGHARAWTPS